MADYGLAATAITVDLALTGPQDTGSSTGTDTLVDLKNLIGSNLGVHLSGNNLANTLTTNSGDDVMDGCAGLDRLDGAGNDVLTGGGDADTLFGDDGDDVLGGGAGADSLKGGVGNDTFAGNTGDDLLAGDVGEDHLIGGDGIDGSLRQFRRYDRSQHPAVATGPQDTGYGTDTFVGVENIRAGGGNDRLGWSTRANTISGGLGNDTIAGIGGDDTLSGEDGGDKIAGGAGNDLLVGGYGIDELRGGAGSDIFAYASFVETLVSQADTIDDFQQGSDRVDLSAMDAQWNSSGQPFIFIGAAAFSGALGAGPLLRRWRR